MNSKVAVIILNWNGWKDTIECLESLYQIDYPNYDVILIDNASEDDSIKKIKEYCEGKLKVKSSFFEYNLKNKPLSVLEFAKTELKTAKIENEFDILPSNNKLILIKNDKNYGFAKGNNIGMRFALRCLNSDYILLLNNDTVVDKHFLNELIKVAEKNERTGMIGSKILNAYNPHKIDSAGHIIKWGRIVDRGHGKYDKGQYDDNENEIIGTMAAASLYSKNMLQAVGLFNESYITNYEDAELSWRAYKQGWKAIFVHKSIVYHKRGQSLTKKNVLSKMVILNTKNTIKTVEIYGNSTQKFFFALVLIKESIIVLSNRFLGRNKVNISLYLKLITEYYLNTLGFN